METRELIDRYTDLQLMIDVEGPGPRVRAVRGAHAVIYRLFRAQERYERLRLKTGVVIEFFERDRPLTATDAKNLTAASAANREITQLLRKRTKGPPRPSAATVIDRRGRGV